MKKGGLAFSLPVTDQGCETRDPCIPIHRPLSVGALIDRLQDARSLQLLSHKLACWNRRKLILVPLYSQYSWSDPAMAYYEVNHRVLHTNSQWYFFPIYPVSESLNMLTSSQIFFFLTNTLNSARFSLAQCQCFDKYRVIIFFPGSHLRTPPAQTS